jgi:hypothetical protein
MSMVFDPKEELDHIAEFADSGVRVFQRAGLADWDSRDVRPEEVAVLEMAQSRERTLLTVG